MHIERFVTFIPAIIIYNLPYPLYNQIDPSVSKRGAWKREDVWSLLSHHSQITLVSCITNSNTLRTPRTSCWMFEVSIRLVKAISDILLTLTWSPHFIYWNPSPKGATKQFAFKRLNINGKLNTLAKPIPKRAMLAIMSFLALRTGNASANGQQTGDMHAMLYLRSAMSTCLNVTINKKWEGNHLRWKYTVADMNQGTLLILLFRPFALHLHPFPLPFSLQTCSEWRNCSRPPLRQLLQRWRSPTAWS